YAEFVHARNHLRELGMIGDVLNNVQQAMDGETFEVEEMYPVYNEIAKLQNEKGAERSTHYALSAEKIHVKMYKKAKELAENGKDYEDTSIHVCPVCGYTVEGNAPEICPICGADGNSFKKF
ncbi:MAG TPA: rubrerythrin family protein, partial [Thermotogales bacterium]|nr:rubrerythrin family protein [Thermotogales bacterium]